jgi:cytidine deaminase
MDNKQLIDEADKTLRRHLLNGRRAAGDTAAALVSESGKIFAGINVDTPSWGFCAERSAIATMVTAGEYKVKKIVAVHRDENGENLTVLPPCGICREFLRQIDYDNMETEVILDVNQVATISELIPFARWPKPLDVEQV